MHRRRAVLFAVAVGLLASGCSTFDLQFRSGERTPPVESAPTTAAPTEPDVPVDELTDEEQALADDVLAAVTDDLDGAGQHLDTAADLLAEPDVATTTDDLAARLDQLQAALGDRAAALEQAELDDNIRALLQFELSADQDELAGLQAQLDQGTTGDGDDPASGDPVSPADVEAALNDVGVRSVTLPKVELLTAVGQLDAHGQRLTQATETLNQLIDSWYSRGGDTTRLVVLHDTLRTQANALLDTTLATAMSTVNLTGDQSGDSDVLRQAVTSTTDAYVDHRQVLDGAADTLRQLPD